MLVDTLLGTNQIKPPQQQNAEAAPAQKTEEPQAETVQPASEKDDAADAGREDTSANTNPRPAPEGPQSASTAPVETAKAETIVLAQVETSTADARAFALQGQADARVQALVESIAIVEPAVQIDTLEAAADPDAQPVQDMPQAEPVDEYV